MPAAVNILPPAAKCKDGCTSYYYIHRIEPRSASLETDALPLGQRGDSGGGDRKMEVTCLPQ